MSSFTPIVILQQLLTTSKNEIKHTDGYMNIKTQVAEKRGAFCHVNQFFSCLNNSVLILNNE